MEIMEKLDPTNVLYHGLAHFLTFKRFDEAYKRLQMVLKSGAILSRNKQREVLPSLGLKPNDYNKVLWNGEDYISICMKHTDGNTSDLTEAYFEFIDGGLSFVLDSSILEELDVKLTNCQDGEIQVKDAIPAKYFLGVTMREPSDEMRLKFYRDWRTKDKEEIEEDFLQVNNVRGLLNRCGYSHLPIYSDYDLGIITDAKSIIQKLKSEQTGVVERGE